MCQSCPPQKLHRTYSKGMVVQIVGKPPRPCASPRNCSSASAESLPCSPSSSPSSSSVDKSENLRDQMMEPVVRVDSLRFREAKSVKGPAGWKMFAGGDQPRDRLEDAESGESDMDIDADTASKSYQGQLCMETYAGDYATKYRTCWR